MISWRLWQALKSPPEDHPLYQHALESYKRTVSIPVRRTVTGEQPSDAFPFGEASTRPKRVVVVQPSNSSRSTLYKVLAVLGLTWFCCCSGGFFFSLPALVLLLAVGTLYGVYTAVRIAGNIAEEHDQGRDELLSLTPSGTLGFSWSVVTGYLYRNTTFSRLRRWIPIIAIILTLLGSGSLLFQVMFVVSTPAYQETFNSDWTQLIWLVYALSTGAAFYIDFYQSVIAGILIAIITPTYGRNRFETQAITLGAFLGVQIVTYLSILMVGFVILPSIYEGLNINGWFAEFILIGLRLGIFVLAREALIVWLWQFAQQRLNIGIGELDLMMPKSKREVSVA